MRCSAFCVAEGYNFPGLFDFLKANYPTSHFREAIHVAYAQDRGDIFLFTFGVVLFWGLSEEEELVMLEKFRPFENESLGSKIKDFYEFAYGDTQRVQRDEIILANKEVVTKLAISFGLAQSARLSVFEETINKTIAKTSTLPIDLAERGKIFLSRRELSQKIGELFIDRSSVNLHAGLLDEPDFFWEWPELGPLYRDTMKCLDMKTRVEVLNHRLGVVGDLLEILSDQLNHQHTTILEWTIIWLIVIEVVLAVLRDIFHLL